MNRRGRGGGADDSHGGLAYPLASLSPVTLLLMTVSLKHGERRRSVSPAPSAPTPAHLAGPTELQKELQVSRVVPLLLHAAGADKG